MTVSRQGPTRSAQFRRVSTKHQETDKQIADLDAWDQSHGYQPSDPYVVRASAFHLKHLPVLERAVQDAEHGEFDVLVFWAADRFWRGESLSQALALLERIQAAGVRVEFVKDPHLNTSASTPAWLRNMLLAQALGMANAESQRKSERSLMDKAFHRAEGSADGRAPFGYEITGAKNAKRFTPTPEGREWIPWIFNLVVQGQSCQTIAKELTRLKVGGANRVWREQAVARIIANPMYRGERRSGGNLEVEALVSFALWSEANAALARRARRGRGSVKHEPPLLRPICWQCYGVKRPGCPDGISVMYRIHGRKGSRSDHNGQFYYRCSGSGAFRSGCGARMIPCAELDNIVLNWFTKSPQRHFDRVFVPGRDVTAELRELNTLIATAASTGDYARVAELGRRASELKDLDDVKASWDFKDTGLTIGEWFRSLDHEGKRAYLADEVVLAERLAGGTVQWAQVILSDEDGI